MTIEEAIDIFINLSVCTKNKNSCFKNCTECCVYVPDKKLIEACSIAQDALIICGTTERYRIQVDKAS